ncbi:MAG: PAS domain-containing protein [Acidiferrobacterales bacterium]|nr:PAS domain-containing protein [Acidiferrobacterales bacterium]
MSQHLAAALNNEQTSLSVLEELAENSFDSVLITDSSPDSKIIYANKAFETLTGFEPSDVIGKTPRILQGPATDKEVIERLRKALQHGERFEGRAINYKKDRTPFMMEWRVIPAKVGGDTKVWLSIQRQAGNET